MADGTPGKKALWYRILRILLRVFVVVLALVLLLVLSISIPAVQTFVAGKFIQSLREKTGTEISLGSLKIAFPNTVNIIVDAGNIWLVNEDPQRPGSEFNFNTFYKQLAVGAGYGFRFDFNITLLRIDLAVPLRKPYLPEGEEWVIKDIDFSPDWRMDNLMWNIAIGYPY